MITDGQRQLTQTPVVGGVCLTQPCTKFWQLHNCFVCRPESITLNSTMTSNTFWCQYTSGGAKRAYFISSTSKKK